MSAFSLAYTANACRRIDQAAIGELGISGIRLMHRAGAKAFETLRECWPSAQSLTIFTGSGNNAGDGFVVAGLAHSCGWSVQLVPITPFDRIRGDAKLALEWMFEQGVRAGASSECCGDVIVDAILGTGATGAIRPDVQQAINRIRTSGTPVLALDIPSGIEPSTGALLTDQPVIANVTATFVGVKLGLLTGAGPECAGDIRFFDLELPSAAYKGIEAVSLIPASQSERHMPTRTASSHKNRYGHVLVIAGGEGMGGAAALASMAALRTGAGLVSVATHPSNVSAVLAKVPEAMVRGFQSPTRDLVQLMTRATCIVIGPGLGQSSWGEDMLSRSLEAGKPLVVDADALNILAHRNWTVPQDCILTPHPGEAAKLLGTRTIGINKNRPDSAVELSSRHRCTVVLKGAGTLVAKEGRLHGVCAIACSALATAGSGDVLSGVIGAARAQDLPAVTAASLGVWLHGSAGIRAMSSANGRSVIASDIIDAIHPWASNP